MKIYSKHLKAAGLVLSSFLLFFSSCKDNTVTETNLGNSRVLLVNGAASSSAINLYWTGNKLNTFPLVYGNTTGYQSVTSGVRNIQIKANFSNTLLATNTIHLVRDSSYSFFVYEANNTTTTVVAEDDLSLPSFGNAKIKFANMSTGLSSADLIISNGPTIASSVPFGAIGNYNELKAGTYNLALRLHGTNTILLSIPNVRVDNGKIYTIWSGGSVNGTTTSTLKTQVIVQ
jgi:hypothetical protein